MKANCSKCNRQIEVSFIEALAYALDDENKIKFECGSCSNKDELLKELCSQLRKEQDMRFITYYNKESSGIFGHRPSERSGVFGYRPSERSGIFKEVRK